jgi:hypothetical protein
MAMIHGHHGRVLHCPHCHEAVEAHVMIPTGLGPSTMVCWKCRQSYRSFRHEWDALSWRGKLLFIGISAVDTVVLVWGGGTLTQGIYRIWTEPEWSSKIRIDASPEFIFGAVIGAVFVISIQIYRVVRSMQRTRGAIPNVPPRPFWNLQTGLQVKVLVCLLLIPAATLLARAFLFAFRGR